DTDFKLAVRGGNLDGTPHHLVDADIAAGRVRHRGTAYTADRDMTVRGIQAQLAGQLADTGLAAGNPDDRRAIDLADPHEPGAGGDVDLPARAIHADIATARLQHQRGTMVQADIPRAGFELTLSEAALRAQRTHCRSALQARACRQLDRH